MGNSPSRLWGASRPSEDTMKFVPTPLPGSFVIRLDAHSDNRGSFARAWCWKEFTDAGLHADFRQWSISSNTRCCTLRGMHYQIAPHEEVKLVSCGQGKIFDVIVDLRPDSPTYRQWFGQELAGDGHTLMYVPRGFAHGFLTLEDNSTVHYHISDYFAPDSARGLRWDDPALAIQWPCKPALMSERDASYPSLLG